MQRILSATCAAVCLAVVPLLGGTAAAETALPANPWHEAGTASWYGGEHQGRKTASGQRFDEEAMTAAHPWLPFGTRIRVTLLGTGRSVVVTITDRGPGYHRVIDLSVAAARGLGILNRGTAAVTLTKA